MLIPYGASAAQDYWGSYYNSTNNLVYVATNYNYSKHVFDFSLNLINPISIPTLFGGPWSISASNNKMYVGCSYQKIVVIENKQVLNSISGCGRRGSGLGTVRSIIFDQFGYMATSCSDGQSAMYLYTKNLIYTGLTLSTNFIKNFNTKKKEVKIIIDLFSDEYSLGVSIPILKRIMQQY